MAKADGEAIIDSDGAGDKAEEDLVDEFLAEKKEKGRASTVS